jgi:hypothetical protein
MGYLMEKKTIKISLILFIAILSCASFDLILSYNYYLQNPEIFIENEANIEFVNYLQEDVFPLYNIFKMAIMFPILLFILSWFDLLKRFISPTENIITIIEKTGRYSTILISLFFCTLYIFSGFTWYDSPNFSMNIYLSIIEKMINTSVGFVMFLLFAITCYILVSEIKINSYKI